MWNRRTIPLLLPFLSLTSVHSLAIANLDHTPLYSGCDRRSMILSSTTSFLPLSLSLPLVSAATDDSLTTHTNYDCLLDLPPPKGIRIYFCRHGQTENNRLHLMQGARLDPPINPTGELMAQRIGMAFQQLSLPPTILYHSNLQRAQKTADLAAQSMVNTPVRCKLEALAEIDVGPAAEGKIVSITTQQTYAAWSAGFINARHENCGESARTVLERCSSALEELVGQARTSPHAVVAAVSHSMYLRFLLATMMDMSLAEATAKIQQTNGCINVVDFDGSYQTIGHKSQLFGGQLSQAPPSFSMKLLAGKVVRLNETRHLQGILTI